MTLDPKKPRPWRLQLHLSTAVILMFTAGGIIWANCVGRQEDDIRYWDTAPRISELQYGWPWPIIEIISYTPPVPAALQNKSPAIDHFITNVILNLIVALVILTVVWQVCEGWIRYRDGRRK
ncbi:MAG: hypothetical protein WCT04_00795 [Planctomycetota bacterium]